MKVQSNTPPQFKDHVFLMSWSFKNADSLAIWDKLQRRETFIKGQVPPYKVEFDSPQSEGPFEKGELNIHHGPLLSLHGAVGEITNDYRDLLYFYGSYVISFRLIRPTRLEFFRKENTITVKISSYVHPLIEPVWSLGLWIFWKTFGISF